jgi:hypothetical protein
MFKRIEAKMFVSPEKIDCHLASLTGPQLIALADIAVKGEPRSLAEFLIEMAYEAFDRVADSGVQIA